MMEVKSAFKKLCFVTKIKLWIMINTFQFTDTPSQILLSCSCHSAANLRLYCGLSTLKYLPFVPVTHIKYLVTAFFNFFFTGIQTKLSSFTHEQQFSKQTAVVVKLSLYSEASSILCSQILCFFTTLSTFYLVLAKCPYKQC